jgi:phosphatidylglycerophosphate synthase
MSSPIPQNPGLIDKFFVYPIAIKLAPILYNLGLTPNSVTTISLFLRLYCALLLFLKIKKNQILIFFFAGWLLDAVDGTMARMYNMKSKFGEKYDVISDLLSGAIIIFVLYNNYYKNNLKPFFIFILILCINYLLIFLKIDCAKNKNELKFWEKKLSFLRKCDSKILNSITNLTDPGMIFFIILIFIYITINKNIHH